jgi:transcriptional regulator with XRE-family HTH domain
MSNLTPDARAADDLDRALGNAIRLRRRSLNLTQDQLASACGISFQQVQKYENGANRVSFSRMVQIARALHCGLHDLTSALDPQTIAPMDLELLQLMTLPGAVDLLRRYAAMSTETRRLLVDLVGSFMAASGAGEASGRPIGAGRELGAGMLHMHASHGHSEAED